MITEGAPRASVPLRGPSSRALVAATAVLVVVTSGATAFVALSGTSGLLINARPGAAPAAAAAPAPDAVPVVVLPRGAHAAAPVRAARSAAERRTYAQALPGTRPLPTVHQEEVDATEEAEPRRDPGGQHPEEATVRGRDRAAAAHGASRDRRDERDREHPGRGSRHRFPVAGD